MTTNNLTASDHAANIRSADQRATAMAATASIAASLALSGTALVADTCKLNDPPSARSWIEWCLALALVCFLLAAGSALVGHSRKSDEVSPEAASTKHRHVTASMALLLAGMICVGVLTVKANSLTIPGPGFVSTCK